MKEMRKKYSIQEQNKLSNSNCFYRPSVIKKMLSRYHILKPFLSIFSEFLLILTTCNWIYQFRTPTTIVLLERVQILQVSKMSRVSIYYPSLHIPHFRIYSITLTTLFHQNNYSNATLFNPKTKTNQRVDTIEVDFLLPLSPFLTVKILIALRPVKNMSI